MLSNHLLLKRLRRFRNFRWDSPLSHSAKRPSTAVILIWSWLGSKFTQKISGKRGRKIGHPSGETLGSKLMGLTGSNRQCTHCSHYVRSHTERLSGNQFALRASKGSLLLLITSICLSKAYLVQAILAKNDMKLLPGTKIPIYS